MRLALLLFVGTLASGLSLASVSGAVFVQSLGADAKTLEAVGGLASTLLWALFGFGAMNVEQVTQTGSVVSSSEPAVAFMAVAFAALMLVVALSGTISLVDVSDVQAGQRR